MGGNGSSQPPDRRPITHVIFYDGVCVLCDRTTRFILVRDHRHRFRYAHLQGQYARDTLLPRGCRPDDLDTMIVLSGSGELITKARAALFVSRELGGWMGGVAWMVGWLPDRILNWAYDCVAGSRYGLFGKNDVCALPSGDIRRKFIDG